MGVRRWARAEHVLRKIHHCTCRSQKLDSYFWTTFFTKNFYSAKFPNDLFCHCTNSLSSLHISIHHCTFCASLHVKTSPIPQGGSPDCGNNLLYFTILVFKINLLIIYATNGYETVKIQLVEITW